MKIKNVVLSKSYTGFYFDDQIAIKAGAKTDGFIYLGTPQLKGFSKIRVPGEAVSIQLVLENGLVATGDCAAVQYSGTDGRDPLFLANEFIPFIEEKIKPLLIGEEIDGFRRLAEKYDQLKIDGKPLHTAIRYGITQALLKATALVQGVTMAEVIRNEYGIKDTTYHPVPVFAQSGDDRYTNVDKMILKEVDVLPHALINNLQKIGKQGETLLEYVQYLRERVINVRVREDYHPIFHIDVYGMIGIIFENNLDKIIDYFKKLREAAHPFRLRIEGPVDAGGREETMLYLRELTSRLHKENIDVEIVADEWCNSLEDIKYFADNKVGDMLQIKTPDLGGVNNVAEAIIYCNERGIGSYVGGTCNETNISTEVTTNIALACGASQLLAKPGMGCDEALMIVRNEMNRVIALINSKGN